jgi:hypothetical protein
MVLTFGATQLRDLRTVPNYAYSKNPQPTAGDIVYVIRDVFGSPYLGKSNPDNIWQDTGTDKYEIGKDGLGRLVPITTGTLFKNGFLFDTLENPNFHPIEIIDSPLHDTIQLKNRNPQAETP